MSVCFVLVLVCFVFDCVNRIDYSSSLVHSPFSERVGLPPHNTPIPGVLMKNIGAAFFYDRMPYLTSTTCVGCNIK